LKTEKRNQTNRPSSKNEPNQDLRGCTPNTRRLTLSTEKIGWKGVQTKIVIYWSFENKKMEEGKQNANNKRKKQI